MNGNHHYEINLNQGDLHITLASDDVYFISKQMEKWYVIMADDSYVPIVIPEAPTFKQPEPEQTIKEALPQPEPIPEPAPAPEPEPQQVVQEAPKPEPQPVQEEANNAEEVLDELADIFEQDPVQENSELEPEPVHDEPIAESTAELEMQPSPTPSPAPPPPISPIGAISEDDNFDAVMDTLMKDLDDHPVPDPEPAPTPTPMEEPLPLAQETPATAVVEDALEEALPLNPQQTIDLAEESAQPQHHEQNGDQNGHSDQPEPLDLNTINTLAELCEQSRANSPEDFLIMSSFFLTEIDGLDKFSLKKINGTLVQSGYTPVNHSVLETVISHDYLALVPDLTGMADVSEYSLTEAGQEQAELLL